MRRFLLAAAGLAVASCADPPANAGLDGAGLGQAGAWPDTLAAPFVALDSLRSPPPDSARVATSGRLLGLDLCPPCPPLSECEACPPDGLVLAGASGRPVRVELPYPPVGDPEALVVGRAYALTVDVRPYAPFYLAGAWLAADDGPRQSLALHLVGLRETE